MIQEVEGVKKVAKPRVEAQEAMPATKAQWRHRYVINQLDFDSLKGSMDVVYRRLCKELADAEHDSLRVITKLRNDVTKQAQVAAKLQEESFVGKGWWCCQLAQGAVGLILPVGVVGLERVSTRDIKTISENMKKIHGIVTKDNFQSFSTLTQVLQTPFQVASAVVQQYNQRDQTKHGAEKAGTDQVGQQLDQEKGRSKEMLEGIRRGQKEQRDSDGQLFAQMARGG